MNRRGFVQRSLLRGGTAFAEAEAGVAESSRNSKPRSLVIDVHVHASKGLNFVNGDPVADPRTTFNDPKWNLCQAEEAGIDQSVIFPIHNIRLLKSNGQAQHEAERAPVGDVEVSVEILVHHPVRITLEVAPVVNVD